MFISLEQSINVMNFLENISISIPQTPFLWLFGGVGASTKKKTLLVRAP